jgi:hypothetical protein
MVLGTKGEKCSVEYFCEISSGRDKNLSSSQGRKMPDIGLKTVLAHEYDGEAAARPGERLHIQSVALPVGDEEHILPLG